MSLSVLALLASQITNLPTGRLSDWQLISYGAKPILELGKDNDIDLSSSELSDAALSQDVPVVPGSLYSLSALVKTVRLDPHGAPVYGAIVAQTPGGGTNLASGPKSSRDTDWTKESVYFRGPSAGKVHIGLFLCGWGRGTGSAHFKNVQLEKVDETNLSMKVTLDPLCQGRINPMQYGQFIEYLCDLVPSMWAEKLYDTSFEGLTPYKFVYLKETDFEEHPWYPVGQPNRLKVEPDTASAISGPTCKRLELLGASRAEAGLGQDGISVNKGVRCNFSVYVKGAGVSKVEVRVGHGSKTFAKTTLPVTSNWRKVSTSFDPGVTDPSAQLAITFTGPGKLWLDSASLMPENAIGGWRPDVVKALTELKPGVIRVGGSVMDDVNLGSFEWKDTIGDPDRRPPFPAWGGQQVPGAGLEEVVQLIQKARAEPLLCVRYEKKTPKDAADEVEYFNGSVETPMGARRARNGHAKPYGIKYWQVGNERWGEQYWRAVPAFCQAMKNVDPTIQLLSSFPSDDFVKIAGSELDVMCPHQYDVENIDATRRELEDVRRMIREDAPGHDMKIGITEWNTTAGDAGPGRAKLWTLKNALDCARYQNLLHRQADVVILANRSNLTNSFCSGIIQTSRSSMFLTPTYYCQKLYANLAGTRPLKIVSEIPVDLSPDTSATLSEDGKTLTLFAVNESATTVERDLDLSAFSRVEHLAKVWVLGDHESALEPDVANSFQEPNRVEPSQSSVRLQGAHLRYKFAPLALTVIRVEVG